MRLRRMFAPMIACLASLGFGLVPAAASAATGGPKLIGSVSDPVNLSGATSVAVSGHYAYSTAYYQGVLTAVDISNPSHPVVVGESAAPSVDARANNVLNGDTVTIAGGYAYVVSKNRNGPCMPNVPPGNCSGGSNDDGTGNALTILDIHTNPAVPSIVGTIRDANKLFGAYGIAVQGTVAYVAAQGCLGTQPCPDPTVGNQFQAIDISNPAAPSIVGTILNPSSGPRTNALQHADSVAISGHYAFVTASASNSLTVIDLTPPLTQSSIKTKFTDPALASPNDVTIQGNYAYVVDQTSPAGRLVVVNISNPTSPSVVGSVQDPSLNAAYRVHVSGNFAYVTSSLADTLAIIDISDPAHPTIVGRVFDQLHLNHTTGLDLAVTGRYIVTSSPYLPTETQTNYPPFPLQPLGPAATGTVSVTDADPNPVSVSVTSPLPGSNYRQGQVVNASYSCTPGGVIPIKSCTGPAANGAPLDTSTLGQHTFTVTGQDQDGQTGSATVTYIVTTTGGGKPVLSGLHQSAKVWREHGRKHAKHKPPLGTTFKFTVSQTSNMTLSFTRIMTGRKVGGRCVAPTKKNRHHRACQRTAGAGTLTFVASKGTNKFPFQGMINGHFLKRGTYTVTVTAMANGLVSSRNTLTFTIV